LDTDASDVAVGAVLSQMVDGVEKQIAYFSRVLNGTQRNYCPTRRELLAVITSLQHFRHYLLGNKVILRTDHHSLKWLQTFKRPKGVLARWIETLAEFDFEIEHRAGRLHSNADAISRQNCKQCWGKVASDNWIDECERADQLVEPLFLHTIQLRSEFSDDAIAELQAEDSEIGKAYEVMSENLDPSTDEFRALPLESRRLLSMQPGVRIQDNLMVKERDGRVQIVVPVVLRKRLFEITYNAAHLGSRRTYQQLSTSYYWYGMRQDIIRWCRQCQHCAKGKGPPLRPHGQLQKIPVGAPMDLVTMDILSGLPTADDGSKYLLVVVDAFTK